MGTCRTHRKQDIITALRLGNFIESYRVGYLGIGSR